MTKLFKTRAALPFAIFGCAGIACATDISGTITRTLTITDNSRLQRGTNERRVWDFCQYAAERYHPWTWLG
jgi:hypothetical protein